MSCTFLDLDIIVKNNRFITRLYDKGRDFSFKVVSPPNMKSNIPSRYYRRLQLMEYLLGNYIDFPNHAQKLRSLFQKLNY